MLRALTLFVVIPAPSAGCGQADLESGGNSARKKHKRATAPRVVVRSWIAALAMTTNTEAVACQVNKPQIDQSGILRPHQRIWIPQREMARGAPKCATGSQLAGIGREQAVNQAVKNLGITTLVIAHRESTVAMAGKGCFTTD